MNSRFRMQLVLCLLVSVPAGAADISVEPAKVDFGERGHNENPSATVAVKNNGLEPVTISEIRPTCSCIRVDPAEIRRAIPPGDAVELTVSMNAGRAMGALHKYVEIRAPRGAKPLRLPVSMSVFEGYRMQPREGFRFEGVVGGDPVSSTVKLSMSKAPQGSTGLSIEDVTVLERRGRNMIRSKNFEAEVIGEPDGTGIRLMVLPSHPEGRIWSELHATLDGKKLVIPVGGDMFRAIKLSPKYFNFNRISPDNPDSFVEECVLTSTDGVPFRIISMEPIFAATPHRDLQLVLTTDSVGAETRHRVWATLSPGFELEEMPSKGRLSGKVVVRTSCADKDSVELRFFGFFSERKQ